jgi:dTDP-glucose pyrophosphorylase
MAGAGARFSEAGYKKAKPFISIKGKMMIERVLDGLLYPNAHYTLIIRENFAEEYKQELTELSLKYKVNYIKVKELTQGACCTALAAHKVINNNIPVVFADCDNIFNNQCFIQFVDDCLNRKIDGSLLVFSANDDRYSYALTDENGYVIKTKEKQVISEYAICGAYMFAHGKDFVDNAINIIIYGKKDKNEFYMSKVFDYAAKQKLKIGIFEITADDWNCVGTPQQLNDFLNK